MEFTSWYDLVPKTEIHLHLEGAIPHEALFELIRKHRTENSITDINELKKRFVFRDFHHFIDTWVWKNSFLRDYDDFEYIAGQVLQNLKKQNVIYVECFISPRDFTERYGLETTGIIEAVSRGFQKIDGIDVSLIVDLVRDFGSPDAMNTLNEICENRNPLVTGIGIGGTEDQYPPELFRQVFRQAQNQGLFTTAHAGEAAGAESVWQTVEILNVTRIGHGIRSIENNEVMKLLKDRQITLEICPVSNVKTGVVRKLSEHPVKQIYDFGIPVTINTDDPGMFGNNLADEYRQLVEHFGFHKKDICQFIRTAAESAFLPEDKKDMLITKLTENPNWVS